MKTLLLAALLLPAGIDLPSPLANEDGFTLTVEDRLQIMALIEKQAELIDGLQRDNARLRGKTGCI